MPFGTLRIAKPLACIEEKTLNYLGTILTTISILTTSVLFGQIDSIECVFKVDTITGEKIYTHVDKMPEPIGGEQKLFEKLGKEVTVNNVPKDEAIGSLTHISFVVNETGKIIRRKTERDDFEGHGIPEQMFRAIESIEWIPGSCNGENVQVEFKLPLRICLR